MYYSYEVTTPTKIESVDSYERRIDEIIYGQMNNVIRKERFMSPFFWLFAILFIPLSVVYLIICICEIITDTVLLPLFCVPYVRIIPFIVSSIIWGIGVAIGIFALVPLTYDIKHKIKNDQIVDDSFKEQSGDTRKKSDSQLIDIDEEATKALREAAIVKNIDIAQNLYNHYCVGAHFYDDMGLLHDEYLTILTNFENAYGKNFFYLNSTHLAMGSAMRKCLATSLYYLFELDDIQFSKSRIVEALSQIILTESLKNSSFFDSSSWFEVRLTIIGKLKELLQ